MNHRPYPSVDRALHQLERGRYRSYHYIRQRPDGVIEETHIHSADALREALRMLADRMPTSAGIAANATSFSHAVARAGINAEQALARAAAEGNPEPQRAAEFLTQYGRRYGKAAITAAIVDQAVKDGEHVHVATPRGVHCAGGDSACPLPRLRPDQPLVLARVVRTCAAVPSQWNAWTAEGQYLYLRYRSGLGTVDAYDTEDSEQWAQPPDGHIAFFDTGERYDGDMTLADFCERAGLQLADDAEVIGE